MPHRVWQMPGWQQWNRLYRWTLIRHTAPTLQKNNNIIAEQIVSELNLILQHVWEWRGVVSALGPNGAKGTVYWLAWFPQSLAGLAESYSDFVTRISFSQFPTMTPLRRHLNPAWCRIMHAGALCRLTFRKRSKFSWLWSSSGIRIHHFSLSQHIYFSIH